ncbi:MAG: WYL domain-containing protein [Clostridia bacterium]|nr:WYL domain-containing protein [Clostridia bacterium]
MIFSELYSAYYNAVAEIITLVINGERDEKRLREAVCDKAFSESVLEVLPSLKSGKWQIITQSLETPIKNKPTLPLTLLQRRWLKAVMLDPRVKLFGIEIEGLEEVEPLFESEDYLVYDKYLDGDDFEDEGYIIRFRNILKGLRESTPLRITYLNRQGDEVVFCVLPERLEYSEKDDKFRLIARGSRSLTTFNLNRVLRVTAVKGTPPIREKISPPETRSVTLRIRDERNALERCMLHFAHFEKHAERLDNGDYTVRVNYSVDDETEMVIRILRFGPFVEVVEPQSFRELIIDRLKKQMSIKI